MAARRQLRIRSPRLGVWLATLLLTAATLALWWFRLRGLGPLVGSVAAPWPVLAAGFLAAEAFVVHLHFRSESGSFSFLELPLVLGVLFCPPEQVVLAMAVGAGTSLFAVRRQPPIKAAFNTANLSLQVGTCSLLLRAATEGIDPLAPAGWLATTVATVSSGAIGVAAIVGVIAITEGRVDVRRAAQMFAVNSSISLANISLALIAAILLDHRPASLGLVTVPTLVLFVAYRSYVSEREQRERAQFLYESTASLRTHQDRAAVPSLLANATTMFRARRADLFLLSAPSSDEPHAHFACLDQATSVRSLDEPTVEAVLSLSQDATVPVIVTAGLAGRLLTLLPSQPSTGMLATLQGEDRPIALLLVSDRLGDVTGFTPDDLILFSTLARQLALALENDQLERAVSQLQQLERTLAHEATHDPLTGLANRALLADTLEQALSGGGPTNLLYIDLDDFKVVNDSLGHDAGDIVLGETARRIRSAVRPGDCVARLGGDEFAVVLLGPEDPVRVARRLIQAIHEPILLPDHEAFVGASVGLATGRPGQDASSLLADADVAMYAAKARGKGTVEVFQAAMREQVDRERRVRTLLRNAIDNDEIAPAYQAIVSLQTGAIVGAEALARWASPEGEVLPAAFIPEAERSGLVVPIDHRVIAHVLADGPAIARALGGPVFVTANLSARHFREDDLVGRVARALEDATVDPSTLVIEVTESVLVHDPEVAIAQLSAIRDLGVRIALDDFGTGYSSLSYLRQLPVDFLKIARPFITDLPKDEAFVRAVIDLGKTLGLTVLAEGIETEEQLRTLQRLGCDLGQGYLLGRPVPLATLCDQIGTSPLGAAIAP